MIGMKQGTGIFALVFDKEKFPTAPIAKIWASDHGFKDDNLEDDFGSFILHQNNEATFKDDGFGEDEKFRTISIIDGVSAIMGFLKSSGQKAAGKQETKVRAMGYFTKVDHVQRLVTGPVLVPNVVDSQGDFELKEEIEKAAHVFMERFRGVDDMHKIFDGIGVPVESHVLRESKFVGERLLPKGTWMVTVKVTNDDTWERVKEGKLRGFSIVFRGTREAVSA